MNKEQMITAESPAKIDGKPNVSGRPIRVQRNRQTKQISPNELTIRYVGRPSKFGNPFKPGEFTMDGVWISEFSQAVELFREYAETNLNYEPEWLNELKGKNLSCWCRLDCCCHADVLLELANR